MVDPYIMPERKSVKELNEQEAQEGCRKARAALRDLEKEMMNRRFLRNAGVQDVKAKKLRHAELTKILKNCLTKLENLGVKEK